MSAIPYVPEADPAVLAGRRHRSVPFWDPEYDVVTDLLEAAATATNSAAIATKWGARAVSIVGTSSGALELGSAILNGRPPEEHVVASGLETGIAAAIMGDFISDKIRNVAIKLEGWAAMRSFNAFQEAASLAHELEDVSPFRDPSLPHTAVAKMLDERRGIYLVRPAGSDEFEVMGRRKFEDFQRKVASNNQPLAMVTVSEAGPMKPQRVTIEQYVGGKLHGTSPTSPAVIGVGGGAEADVRWFDRGRDISDRVAPLAARAPAATVPQAAEVRTWFTPSNSPNLGTPDLDALNEAARRLWPEGRKPKAAELVALRHLHRPGASAEETIAAATQPKQREWFTPSSAPDLAPRDRDVLNQAARSFWPEGREPKPIGLTALRAAYKPGMSLESLRTASNGIESLYDIVADVVADSASADAAAGADAASLDTSAPVGNTDSPWATPSDTTSPTPSDTAPAAPSDTSTDYSSSYDGDGFSP